VKLIGQKELFWLQPEGRWISPAFAPPDIFIEDETILLASQGTLGESEVFCRGELITGDWTKYAYSQHLLRVRSGIPAISGAFLFAFLRSETVFRCLRSMSRGSKLQDFHRGILARLPVPIPSMGEREEIERLIRSAYQARHEALILEEEAIKAVEDAIHQEAST
jgi:type I restriction enzyme S subunit